MQSLTGVSVFVWPSPQDQLKKQSRSQGLAATPSEKVLQVPRAPKREIITEKPDPTPWSIPQPHDELRAQENAKILFLGVCGALGSWIPVDSSLGTEIPQAL